MKDKTDTETRRNGDTEMSGERCFCSVSPCLRVSASATSSFQNSCQKLGFGVKSPRVFETMATGAFSKGA